MGLRIEKKLFSVSLNGRTTTDIGKKTLERFDRTQSRIDGDDLIDFNVIDFFTGSDRFQSGRREGTGVTVETDGTVSGGLIDLGDTRVGCGGGFTGGGGEEERLGESR